MAFEILIVILIITVMITYLLERHLSRRQTRRVICAVLGSGGHTTELVRMISRLSAELRPTLYVCGENDRFSAQKVKQTQRLTELSDIIMLPRPRNVGQSYLSSIFSSFKTIVYALSIFSRERPSLVPDFRSQSNILHFWG